MSTPSPQPADDEKLNEAFRARRRRDLATRSQPDDSATGTSRVAQRLAIARAEARLRPRTPREVIDLTD